MAKKISYEEIVEVFSNQPDISGPALAKIFKKDSSWGTRLKQFYFASKKEKEQLKNKHPAFKAFYNLYIEYLKNNPSPEPVEEKIEIEEPLVREEENMYEEEISQNLQELIEENKKLEQMVISLTVEIKHLREYNKVLIEDNAAKGLNINRAIKSRNVAWENVKKCGKELKYYKLWYWIMLIGYGIEIISYLIVKG